MLWGIYILTNSFCCDRLRTMLSLLLGKKVENRGLRRKENPLLNQVRKVLSSADQQLILMVRS